VDLHNGTIALVATSAFEKDLMVFSTLLAESLSLKEPVVDLNSNIDVIKRDPALFLRVWGPSPWIIQI